MLERVQKILAAAGIGSRRACEKLIAEGRVKVNNHKIKLGDKADSIADVISVGGKIVRAEKKVYFLLNKPKRVLSAVSDPLGRKTVVDLVDCREKIFPVGRLDRDSRGLSLLTNDGLLANRIMHPRYGVEKTYLVVVREKLSDDAINSLKKGVFIEGRKVVPSRILMHNKNCIEIVLHEGRKHIVKRIFFKLGFFVVDLFRTKIANLSVNGIDECVYRELTNAELIELRRYLKIA